jgi:hypothetical protein
MRLQPVESSHIAAIGYLEAERVLLVRYKDGSLYAQPGWNSVAWDQLQRAQSKGKAIKACAVPMILISKGIASAECGNATMASSSEREAAHTAPLNVIDEDADRCCRSRLKRRHNAGALSTMEAWSCMECGTVFKPEMVGPNRHWRIVPSVAIVRPR